MPTRRQVLTGLVVAAALVMSTVWPAAADHVNEGNVRFKTTCKPAGSAMVDPIVTPGGPSAHLHDFFGAKGVTSTTTTYAQLLALPTTCNDPGDHAGYWVPSVYVNGVKRAMTTSTAYYRLGGKHGPIEPYPPGLKIVAGYSLTNPAAPHGVTGWQCNEANLPNPTPAGCTADLTMRINFPDCWDGVNLDSADHRSHMAYSVDTGPAHVCPATHPHPVPALTTYNHYGTLRSTDVVTLSSGDITQGLHGDFFNGWTVARLAERIETCLIGLAKCPSGG